MLSSSLPSGSAVPLFMAYFLGNCGNQIWSHAHFFMFGLLTLFQSLLWNCALENSTEQQNYEVVDAHRILLLHLLYSLREFLQIHDLISIWRMRSDTSDTTINPPKHERGKEPTRFAGHLSQMPSAELVEGSEHCSGYRVKGRQERRRWLPKIPPKC